MNYDRPQAGPSLPERDQFGDVFSQRQASELGHRFGQSLGASLQEHHISDLKPGPG
jgi:hypothetical protein